MPDGEPVETPDDVKEVVDPLGGAREGEAPTEDEENVDSMVEAAKAARASTAPAQQAGQKVCLIVDDSRVIRKVSTKIVTALGYKAMEAQDGMEALARCKRAMPDIVITDWDMPEMDGLEFVTQLRAIPTPKPPLVMFCTSKSKAADVHAGIKAGADDYIVKPFDEAALKAKLERLGRA